MNCIIETELSNTQLLFLPLFTPYSVRHLKKSGWLNKVIGVIEIFPVISIIATAIELIVKNYLFHPKNLTKNSLKNMINETFDQKQTQRVVIVANKNIFMRHETGEGHPESPKRVEAIESALKEAKLMTDENSIKPRQATKEEISSCHDEIYQKELESQIESLRQNNQPCFQFIQNCYADNVQGDFNISPETLNTSRYAAGAPLTAIEHILDEKNKTSRAFCIIRPPGHHAHKETGSGFCVFNNVAIAAKHLTEKLNFKRVLIVDWDAHHGDGTQRLTEENGKIFYFSTHKDTSNGFYPGRSWGQASDRGPNKERTVMNCPVSGTAEECRTKILEAFRIQLTSAMDQYKPDFVLISCGFDAHENDSLVGLGLKNEDYKEMTEICVKIAEKYAKGRIVSVLEGGYDLTAISEAAKIHVQALGRNFQ